MVKGKQRVVLAIILGIIVVLGVFLAARGGGEEEKHGPPRALYYDSLSREYPNPELRERIVSLLESYGYVVDVYVNETAGLEPLEELGKYDIIILRAHGAYNGDPGSRRPLGTYVYTGLLVEEAIKKYGKGKIEGMLRKGDLALGVVPPPGYEGNYTDLPQYITVSPQFFDARLHSMKKGSVVVFTGCYGMDDDRLAKVFTGKGSAAFVGWRGNVTWAVADSALEAYIRDLLETGDPARALSMLPEDLRVDPFTGAQLLVYGASRGRG